MPRPRAPQCCIERSGWPFEEKEEWIHAARGSGKRGGSGPARSTRRALQRRAGFAPRGHEHLHAHGVRRRLERHRQDLGLPLPRLPVHRHRRGHPWSGRQASRRHPHSRVTAMSATEANAKKIDMKLEVVVIPVSDVERARKFYVSLGWRQDVTPPGSGIVQLTPPGSGCSVQFGGNRTTAAPGSAQGLWLIVSDIQAALDKLAALRIPADEVFHIGEKGREGGLDPERRSYRSYASFRDPDGNRWLFQEITTRLPGRIDSAETTFANAPDLADRKST